MNLLNKLTIKNLKLNKKRTVVTIIGIMLSVALLTAVSSMYYSFVSTLVSYEKKENGSFHVVLYNVPASEEKQFEYNKSLESVSITESLGYSLIEVKTEGYKPYAHVIKFSKGALDNIAPTLISGRLPENSNEVLIPSHLKTRGRLDLKEGDTITLNLGTRVDEEGNEIFLDAYKKVDEEVNETLINQKEKTFTVVGIVSTPSHFIEFSGDPGYSFITYGDSFDNLVNVYIKFKKESLKDIYINTGRFINIDPELFNKFYHDEPLTEKEDAIFEEQYEKRTYRYDFNKRLIGLETDPLKSTGLDSVGIVVIIVLAIIIFTSVFCIKNSFDISITEKIKQYGMLRSIGATKKQIKKNVFYEATILGIIGIPLGILFGLLASFILVFVTNYFLGDAILGNSKLLFDISWIVIIISILLGIITIYFSAFSSARKASKISPIDSIRNSANIKIKNKSLKCPKFIKNIFGIGGEISYKNIKRNKRKYRTTTISIIVSVFVFIALSTFMNTTMEATKVQVGEMDYNIYIGSYSDTRDTIDGLVSSAYIDKYSIIRDIPGTYTKSYYSKEYIDRFGDDNTELKRFIIRSISDDSYNDFIKELGLSKEYLKDKAILFDSDVVSTGNNIKETIRLYNLNKGDKVSLNVNDVDTTITIGAVTTSKIPFGMSKKYDVSSLIVSEEYYDKIFKGDSYLQTYVVANNASKFQDEAENKLTGYEHFLNNAEEEAKILRNLFILVAIFLYGFIIVISLIGITNIFNTLTTSMQLRKPEFAMLKSIGMTSKEFNRMIRLESLFMGLKSLLIGIPIGIVLSYIIHFAVGRETGIPYSLPIIAILISILVVFLLLTIIMHFSISKISKQNTIETIRNENI